MKDSLVVVFANIKPGKMRGIVSEAMVFAAKTPEGKVELVSPPQGAIVGERLWIEGLENGDADKQINAKKKNSAWRKP
eukprot:UN02176